MMHIIFNDIIVYGKQIWEIEHPDVPKIIKLEFEFSKTTITKNDTFLHKLMLLLVNINGKCNDK